MIPRPSSLGEVRGFTPSVMVTAIGTRSNDGREVRMRRRPMFIALAVALVAAALAGAAPALAITGGQRDTVHTNVGLVRFTLPEGQGSVKVPECLVHGLVMPRRGRTRVASRALRRRAAAMLR
jgi:hypothetical protein